MTVVKKLNNHANIFPVMILSTIIQTHRNLSILNLRTSRTHVAIINQNLRLASDLFDENSNNLTND